MGTIRAFIAVEIDRPNKEKLLNIISSLKKSNADVKWINENQMHLTLKFLGNVEENKILQISNALKPIADNFSPFSITFSKIGAFPNIHQPRVVWVGIQKGADELKNLSTKIEGDLEILGFPKEKRSYTAHLTLGRTRSLKNITNLTDLIKNAGFSSQNEIKINELILFKSTLTSAGAIYTPISKFNLGTIS
jgi:2'-5' RNA ligase